MNPSTHNVDGTDAVREGAPDMLLRENNSVGPCPLPTRETGPNGGRIEILSNGDTVEWIKDLDDDEEDGEWPMLMFRGHASVVQAYEEFRRGISWRCQVDHQDQIESGEILPSGEYDVEETDPDDDFHWGLLCGRESALAWALGAEWHGYRMIQGKADWIDLAHDQQVDWPRSLRRGQEAVLAAYKELWDKVWFYRKMVHMGSIADGKRPRRDNHEYWEGYYEAARVEFEKKYGVTTLVPLDDYEWGRLSGRMSAMAWVLGAEWDETLDT